MKRYFKLLNIILISIIFIPVSTYALNKTEMVYSYLDSNGSIKKTNINTQLSSISKGDIVDYTDLDKIKNINGNEKFTRENKKITWKSTGKDIFYQGKINKELPISIKINYYLNDKEISFKDLVGKSGNVKIIYKFKNNNYDYNSGMYTPFVISMISTIDNNVSNVSITNGKVISTGEKSVITGIASPGLYDNLPIEEIKNIDEIIVNYNTTKYSSNDVYFVASPKLLDDVDISKFNKIDSLYSSLNTLQDGMNKLENGSIELVNGVDSLTSGTDQLNAAIKQALDGSSKITAGLNQLGEGTSKFSKMNDLVEQLYASYKENKELLSNIQTGKTSEEIMVGIKNATDKKTSLENNLNEVTVGISQLEPGETAGVLNEEQIVKLNTLRATKTQLEDAIKQIEQGIVDAQNTLASLPQAAAKLSGAVEVLEQVLSGILGGEITDENINIFHENMNSLVNGVSSLKDGSNSLTSGLNEIYNGSSKLNNGSIKLKEGSSQLKDGIVKINSDGIKKLSDYGNKLKGYSSKVKQLINLSKNYKGFASNNSDNTLFIYKLS